MQSPSVWRKRMVYRERPKQQASTKRVSAVNKEWSLLGAVSCSGIAEKQQVNSSLVA